MVDIPRSSRPFADLSPHQARPCPFYSQGRCLFSDSCSFLHQVKIKVPTSSVRVSSSVSTSNGDDTSSRPIDLAPGSEPPVSPSRSPRMTGLLLALKGVISDDEDDELEFEATGQPVPQAIESLSYTLDEGKSEGDLTTDSGNFAVRASPEAHNDAPAPTEEGAPPNHPPEATISVIDENTSSMHQHSIDPTTRGPTLSSPPASDKPSRDDSVDSGYAEFRSSAPPLTLSPQPPQWRHSTLNLLSSPFGSPTTRAFSPARGRLGALISPRFGSFPSSVSERAPSPTERVAETVGMTRRHSDTKYQRLTSLASFPVLGKDQSPPQDDPFCISSPSQSSLDSPGAYPALALGSTSPHKDNSDTKPPTMGEPAPNRKRASSTVTIMPRSDAVESPPPLPESLPWTTDAEDDTVTTMYGLYHSSSSDHVWSPPSPVQNYSRPSSSASFYPPLPPSTAPELLSPRSPPNDNRLTRSPLVPNRSSPTLSIRSDLGPSSSTVPIGSRDHQRHGSRRTSMVLRRPQPLILSPQNSAEPRQLLSSGPRSLKPLRLSMILNSDPSLTSPNENPPSASSPAPSTRSDFSISNSRLLSSARSSIIPERLFSTPSTRSLSPLPLNTPSGSHQHYLSNFGSLSHITAPSPTLSQASTSSSAIRRQYNPLIPNRDFSDSTHLHSRGSSATSEPFYSVREEEEDVWNARNERDSNIDLEETIRRPFPTSHSPHLRNLEGESIQPRSAFTESPMSTAAPILSQMIEAHSANPSRSPTTTSGSPHGPLTRHHAPTLLHKQTVHPTPHRGPSPVFTKDPGRAAIANARHFTQTHTHRQPSHAIATPRPTLMFAIASDDVSRVRRVLESGEADPNDQVGPQSALKFALTNEQLTNRLDIVKTLLAYGADPAGLKKSSSGGQEHSRRSSVVISGSSPAHVGHGLNSSEIDGRKEVDPAFEEMKSQMDPATRYFINRADAPKTRRTSTLIHRSFFRPLTRMRYDIVGQDCAFEQLFRCLSIQSQNLSATPLVVMLCGPSGHGKSLFARKFGSLLGVPTHTVNMTTLRCTHDLWQSYSMSPYEEPSTSTLAEFLTDNEGNRCVVVLDVRIFLLCRPAGTKFDIVPGDRQSRRRKDPLLSADALGTWQVLLCGRSTPCQC